MDAVLTCTHKLYLSEYMKHIRIFHLRYFYQVPVDGPRFSWEGMAETSGVRIAFEVSILSEDTHATEK